VSRAQRPPGIRVIAQVARTGVLRPPATRDQADAYRFGVRRLESALVRADPVPLHERLRSQRRAAVAGALIGMLAIGAVTVWSLVSPRPDWTRQAIVVGKQSGALYVVAHRPDRLVPVANLVAARLVMGALRGGGSVDADPASAVPVVVPDADLAGAPRHPAAAVPGAWAVRPEAAGIPPQWAVCDTTVPPGDEPARFAGTTVVAGAAPGAPVDPGTGALLTVPGGSTSLVLDGRRHRVDPDDTEVLAALGLGGASAREASPGLVSALPEGPELEVPVVPGAGSAGPPGLAAELGDVLVSRAGSGPERFDVLLADGRQEIGPLLAGVLVGRGAGRHELDVADAAGVPVVEVLDVGAWPHSPPRPLAPAEAPVLCWAWSGAQGAAPTGTFVAGDRLPAPAGAVTVELAQADGPGELADAVVLGPAGAGPVLAGGPGSAPAAGGLRLISETGVTYRVVDGETAAVLGVRDPRPAPEAAVRLLPAGHDLDLAEVGTIVDVLRPAG